MRDSDPNNTTKWHQRKGIFVSLGLEIMLEALFGLIFLGIAIYFFAQYIIPILIGLAVIALIIGVTSAGGV